MNESLNKHATKSLSNSQANALAKNRIEKKRLNDQISHFNKEYKYNTKSIIEIIGFSKVLNENIKTSTGSLFARRDSPVTPIKSASSNQSIDKEVDRNYYDRSQSAFVNNNETDLRWKKNLSRSFTSISTSQQANKFSTFSQEEYMRMKLHEKTKKKARSGNSAMKPILTEREENRAANNSFAFMKIKDKNMSDWNKYLARKKLMHGEVDLKQFTFEDRAMYTVYLNLMDEKDSVPHHSKQQIEFLKKSDPVFYKRYKHFLFAKMCNKAPHFDSSDHKMPPLIKYTLEKAKHSMIKENNISHEPIKPYQIQMDNINERTREFLQSF